MAAQSSGNDVMAANVAAANLTAETTRVTVTVQNARPIEAKSLFALVDLELDIDGLVVSILGVQARRSAAGGTEVGMPRFRQADGSWTDAVVLPDELWRSVVTAVLQHLVEQSFAHNKLVRPRQQSTMLGWP